MSSPSARSGARDSSADVGAHGSGPRHPWRIGVRRAPNDVGARRSGPTTGARSTAALITSVALVVVGCTAGGAGEVSRGSATDSAATAAPAVSALATIPPRPVDHSTLWLCRPGQPDNPCEGGLDAKLVADGGVRTVEPFTPAEDPGADCFYVYPTVSEAPGDNAPLEVTDAEVLVVRAQAARFAAACRVYAPMYRQITRIGLVSGALASEQARELAYGDVLSAFNDYLNAHNAGRPYVLIGHSQGAINLTRLIQQEVDGDPALRSRMLSALLLGTSVTTRPGAPAGGTFAHVPACQSPGQSGCVVSYVSYPGTPPGNGIFGQSTVDRKALCVSPAALLGRDERLSAYLPTAALTGSEPLVADAPETGFVAFPGAITGTCRSTARFGWLDVSIDRRITDLAPTLGADRDPAWGLHRADVNLALGDLVDLVSAQADAWRERGGRPSE